ncbi:PREDICTED: alpha-2-macroglobulin-like [Nanorana parkeri]|uniref:alpha-2-macroglobulin-like n=1 Tax=Nanorana parkeri TaxID=125878 RepID=UPI000854DD1E|nr:PREDICTED: alpha-2-macroglobulin-like [Nanorana parkeri]
MPGGSGPAHSHHLPLLEASEAGSSQYVLSSPASLLSGETGKACVNIVGNTEKLDVSLILQHEGKNTTIIGEDVSLPSYFQCADYKFPTVYLMDPSRTRIKQWRNQETKRGVLSMEFPLINDAPVGSYNVIAERESSYSMSQYFTVEEYVLPRFSVAVDVPDTISALQGVLKFSISATYTYGEPVAGKVTTLYCKQSGLYGRRQNCLGEKGEVCSNMTGELSREGVYNGAIDMSGRSMGLTGMSVRLESIITEDGTGIQVSNSRYVWVTTQPARLNFDYSAMNQHYKRGIPYPIVARLVDQEKPIPNEDVEIELNQNLIGTVKTDSDGKIEYGMDTSNMVATNFTVRISYKNPDQCYYADWRDTDYPTAEYTAFRFYSRTGSFIQAKRVQGELKCGQSKNFEMQYAMSRDGVGEKATSVRFYYLVMARSKIIHAGHQDADLTSSMNGSVYIPLSVSADMAPNANLVVFSILKGEVVVEKVSMDIEKCFKNKVDMAFSEEKGMPGATAEVLLSGDPESICGLRVIDSSLLLLNRYERFSPESIHGLFSYWSYGYDIAGFNVEDPEPQCLDPNKLIFFKGIDYLPVSSDSEGDSYQNLKEAGLIFATRDQVRKPKVCDYRYNQRPNYGLTADGAVPEASISLKSANNQGFAGGAGGGGGPAIETVRTNFSDTFMWFMVPLDKDGHAALSEIVPDTITQWKGTAFCLSDKGGFGMTKYAANYTTYLPFFVELTKPYSFIRGETLVLVAVVQNYLEQAVKVRLTLVASNAFTAQLKEGTQDACVLPKNRASYSWEVQANVLGEISFSVTAQTTFIGQSCDGSNDASQPPRKDTVVQSILVEPEGISQELTLSNLVFVKLLAHTGLHRSVLFRWLSQTERTQQPPLLVSSSFLHSLLGAPASKIILGDVFGLPLQNLKDLVQKPYGCAEQNLARVAPIVHVLDYLNNTGQLTPDILEKGKQYILEGYYRHLGYASGDAYRVFHSSVEPNSWLTVYSMKTFEQAKRYIEIDETRQQQTLIWLENQQRLDNGCFEPQGTLFTFQVRKDTNSSIHYTAYVAISLLESKYSLGKTLLDGAMGCLKNASKTKQKTGDEVLMLYAFTLAGLPEYRDPLMAKLMKKAIVKDGTIHWEREDMPTLRPVPFFFPIYNSAEVQLTAYMLLSMIQANVKPTTPAMPALGSNKPKSTVAPPVSEKVLATMAQMSLWLTRQQNAHGGFPSTSDTVVGLQALAAFAKLLYMTVIKYNIPIPKDNSAFSLSLSTASNTCLNGVTKAFNMTANLSYRGKRKAAGMTMIKIRMLSGYHPDFWSLRQPISFTFRVLMGERVLNVKKSSAVAYDYYQQDLTPEFIVTLVISMYSIFQSSAFSTRQLDSSTLKRLSSRRWGPASSTVGTALLEPGLLFRCRTATDEPASSTVRPLLLDPVLLPRQCTPPALALRQPHRLHGR